MEFTRSKKLALFVQVIPCIIWVKIRMFNKPTVHFFVSLMVIIAFPMTCIAVIIAFERDGEIWIADIQGKNEKFICKGHDPSISPDGKFIAFTLDDSVGRRISIVDINTRKSVALKIIPGNNSYGPSWSPNNKSIAFHYRYSILDKSIWTIGLVEKDDSTFRILFRKIRKDLNSPTWGKDGKLLICHDLENLYQLNLKGSIIREISLDKLINIGCDSASKFILSSDGNNIIYSANSDDSIEKLREPASALFFYSIIENTVNKITPQGLCALRPFWVKDKEIIFEGFQSEDIDRNNKTGDIQINRKIYRMNIYGKNPSVLLENGSSATASVK